MSGRPAQTSSTNTTRSIPSSGTFDFARLVAPHDTAESPEPSRARRNPFLTTPAVDSCAARPVAMPTHVEPHGRPCNCYPYTLGSSALPPSSSLSCPTRPCQLFVNLPGLLHTGRLHMLLREDSVLRPALVFAETTMLDTTTWDLHKVSFRSQDMLHGQKKNSASGSVGFSEYCAMFPNA
jgi:hypothetical protein